MTGCLLKNRKGFTLIELLIAMGILTVVLMMIYSFFQFGLRMYRAGETQKAVQQDVRLAVNYISGQIKYANTLTILENIDENTFSFDPLKRYIYLKTVGANVYIRQYKAGLKYNIPGGISNQLTMKFKPGSVNNKLINFNISGTSNQLNFNIISEIMVANLASSITSSFLGTDGEALCYTAAPLGDPESVAVDKTDLSIPLTISDNIFLPSVGGNGTVITWTEPLGYISPGGTVTRPGYGSLPVTVSLTALLSKGSVSDTKNFDVTITPQTMDLYTTPPPEPPMVNHPYSQTYSVTGGAPPYKFILASGSLPDGLSLSEDGVLSGTPVYSNSFNFTIRVTDAANDNASKLFSLAIAKQTVDPAFSALDLSSTPLSIRKGNQFSFKVLLKDNTPLHQPVSGLCYPGNFIFNCSGGTGTLTISKVEEEALNTGIYTVTASYSRPDTVNMSVSADGVSIPSSFAISITN